MSEKAEQPQPSQQSSHPSAKAHSIALPATSSLNLLSFPPEILLHIFRFLLSERMHPEILTRPYFATSLRYPTPVLQVCKTFYALARQAFYVEQTWDITISHGFIEHVYEVIHNEKYWTLKFWRWRLASIISMVKEFVDRFLASNLAKEIRSVRMTFALSHYAADFMLRTNAMVKIWRQVCRGLKGFENLRKLEFTAVVDLDRSKIQFVAERRRLAGRHMVRLLRSLKPLRDRGVSIKLGDAEWWERKMSEEEKETYCREAMGEVEEGRRQDVATGGPSSG